MTRILLAALAAFALSGCAYFEQKKADDDLKERIMIALMDDRMARQIVSQLRITVNKGRVGVQGHVADDGQRLRVIAIVTEVEGVVEVIDSLTVDDAMNVGAGGMYAY